MPALNQNGATIIPGHSLLARAWVSDRRLAWLVLFVILGAVAARDAALLWRYPVAAGVDGYYYVLQIQYLITTSHLYFLSATPVVLYLLAGLSRLTHDPIIAIKLGALLLNILLAFGIFAVVKSLSQSLWLAVLASALALAPQSHIFLISEYINNLGALAFLVWGGWCLIRAFQTRRRIWLLPATVLMLAALLSHRSTLGILFTLFICGVLLLLWRGRKWRTALVALIVLFFAPPLVSLQLFWKVPLWLQQHISIAPHWPFDRSALPEELLLAICSTALLFLLWRKSKVGLTFGDYVFGSLALWSLLITLNPFLNPATQLSGLAGRLRILSYLQASLVVPWLIFLAYAKRRALTLYLAAMILTLFMLSIVAPLPHGVQDEFLQRRQALIAGLKSHAGPLGQKPVVIARHGNQFVVTATIGVPSQHQPPALPLDSTIYWLLEDVSDQQLEAESIVLMNDRNGATLLTEDGVVQRRLQASSSVDRQGLLRANPELAAKYYR